jgi:hypothetical protein
MGPGCAADIVNYTQIPDIHNPDWCRGKGMSAVLTFHSPVYHDYAYCLISRVNAGHSLRLTLLSILTIDRRRHAENQLYTKLQRFLNLRYCSMGGET